MACPTALASNSPLCASLYSTIPSNCESPSRLSTKRKHSIGMQHAASRRGNKRAKATGRPGRPRNLWTRSRSRKLIRLYLMSPLDVNEIAAVLRSTDFEPWCVPSDIYMYKHILIAQLVKETSKNNSRSYFKNVLTRSDRVVP
jgi:hypothetical protein